MSEQEVLDYITNLEQWAMKAKLTDVYLRKPDGSTVIMNTYDKSERPIPQYLDYEDEDV